MSRRGLTGASLSSTRAARGSSSRSLNSNSMKNNNNSNKGLAPRSASARKRSENDLTDLRAVKQLQQQQKIGLNAKPKKENDWRRSEDEDRFRNPNSLRENSGGGAFKRPYGDAVRSASPRKIPPGFGMYPASGVGSRLPTIMVCDQDGTAITPPEPPDDSAMSARWINTNSAMSTKVPGNQAKGNSPAIFTTQLADGNGLPIQEWQPRQTKQPNKLNVVDHHKREQRLAEKVRMEQFLKAHQDSILARGPNMVAIAMADPNPTGFQTPYKKMQKLKLITNGSPLKKRESKHDSLLNLNRVGSFSNRRIHSQLISDRERVEFFKSSDFGDLLRKLRADDQQRSEYIRGRRTRNSILRRVFTCFCFRRQKD